MNDQSAMEIKTSKGAVRPWGAAVLLVALLAAIVVGVSVSADTRGAESGTFLPIVNRAHVPPESISLELYADLNITHTQDCDNDGISGSPIPGTITDIAHAGDGRLFVAERSGVIHVINPDGTVRGTPFLDISNLVKGFPDCQWNWEEGLLGIAFHPNYADNGYFYVTYTGANPDYGDPNAINPEEAYQILLRRFQVSDTDPNVANPVPDPAAPMMLIGKPYSENEAVEDHSVHNGGDLEFGPDGYLYIAVGEGGPDPHGLGTPEYIAGDKYNHGQRLDVNLAKILRIDVDFLSPLLPNTTRCSRGQAYAIPLDNPHVALSTACDEIWANGLRNPWRMSFDRVTGDLYISDVGEWAYDEINFQPSGVAGGQNYGWRCYEGTLDYSTVWPEVSADCTEPSYIDPVIAMPTYQVPECSITGGFVYRGTAIPGLNGHYIYADFCSGKIWRAQAANGWTPIVIGQSPAGFGITTFGEGVDGELYVGGNVNTAIYKIVP